MPAPPANLNNTDLTGPHTNQSNWTGFSDQGFNPGDITANTWTPTQMEGDYRYDVVEADVGNMQAASWNPELAGYQTYDPITGEATGYDAATGQATGYQAGLLNGAADYTPAQVEAEQWAAYMRDVENNDLVRHHLNELMSEDSDLRKRAEARGMQYANRRGLLNSTMGAEAAYAAQLDRMMPIAQQDAGTYNQRALADMQYTNQSRRDNANLRQQANIFNSGAQNDASRFAGENMRFDVGESNLANRFNANAINDMTRTNMDNINRAAEFSAGAQNDFGLANLGILNRAAEFGANAYNQNQLDNTNYINQSRADNAQLSQSAQELMAQLITDNNQFNANNLTDSFRDSAEWGFLTDKINKLSEDQAASDAAASQNQFDMQRMNNDFNAWSQLADQRHESTMAEINAAIEKGIMDHQAGINMKGSFTGDFNGIISRTSQNINRIATDPSMDSATKDALIQQEYDVQDAAIDALVSVYGSFPEMSNYVDNFVQSLPQEETQEETKEQDEEQEESIDGEQVEQDVSNVYETVLGRKPDRQGLEFYTNEIVNGNMTIDDVQAQLEKDAGSDKNAPMTKLNTLFNDYFGREPDQSAIDTYLPMIEKGQTDKVIEALENSEESKTANDIANLYESILGRQPDKAGLSFWLDAVMSGEVTLDEVEQTFKSDAAYGEATGTEV